MAFHQADELETSVPFPDYSTASGNLVLGEQIELRVMRAAAGGGAKMHRHPEEQIIVVLSGRIRVTLGDQVGELGKGGIVRVPPNVPHMTEYLEDIEFISVKSAPNGESRPELLGS
jgi:quercetin dioxygenase-like cupin family protein